MSKGIGEACTNSKECYDINANGCYKDKTGQVQTSCQRRSMANGNYIEQCLPTNVAPVTNYQCTTSKECCGYPNKKCKIDAYGPGIHLCDYDAGGRYGGRFFGRGDVEGANDEFIDDEPIGDALIQPEIAGIVVIVMIILCIMKKLLTSSN